MDGIAALTLALKRGGGVVWEPPDRPKVRVPEDLLPAIWEDAEAVREALKRAVIFRAQAETHDSYPFFHLPESPEPDFGRCISCGQAIPQDRWRCDLCQLAKEIALEGIE